MKKLLLLLWLPLAAFSSPMYITPEMVVDTTDILPDYTTVSSWYSYWLNNIETAKTNNFGNPVQNTTLFSGAALTSTNSLGSGTLAASDPPAAIATNPEPGTWGLLLLGIASGFAVLRRRRTKQPFV